MAEQGKISAGRRREAPGRTPRAQDHQVPQRLRVDQHAEFSCDYVRRYLLRSRRLGQTVEERQRVLERGGLTIKSNIDLRMQKAINKRRHVDRRRRPTAGHRRAGPGRARHRQGRGRRPVPTDGTRQEEGQSYINFAVPTALRRLRRLPGRLDVQDVHRRCGAQEGHRRQPDLQVAAAHDDSGRHLLRLRRRRGPARGRSGTRPSSGNDEHVHRHSRKSVNTYFAQLERDAGLCNAVQTAESMGIKVPRSATRSARSPSASPTSARSTWPPRTPCRPRAACTASRSRSTRSST